MFLVLPTCLKRRGGWIDFHPLHSRLRRGKKGFCGVRCSTGPAAERTIPAGYELDKREIDRSKPDPIKQVRQEIESDSEEPGPPSPLSPPLGVDYRTVCEPWKDILRRLLQASN